MSQRVGFIGLGNIGQPIVGVGQQLPANTSSALRSNCFLLTVHLSLYVLPCSMRSGSALPDTSNLSVSLKINKALRQAANAFYG